MGANDRWSVDQAITVLKQASAFMPQCSKLERIDLLEMGDQGDLFDKLMTQSQEDESLADFKLLTLPYRFSNITELCLDTLYFLNDPLCPSIAMHNPFSLSSLYTYVANCPQILNTNKYTGSIALQELALTLYSWHPENGSEWIDYMCTVDVSVVEYES